MIKSDKGQFIIFIITAILFVINSFLHLLNLGAVDFITILFYFIMVLAVFNAGMTTEKYMQNK
ncbi:hypothetical protein [Halobacillus seohaensis]|uniref:Uncharacterized protein n=1 Tax=Halobacillus seohaensis TaxID=447421 RepID=A0ABW2EPN5_9BACI